MNPNLERFARRTAEFDGFVVKELTTAADLAAIKDDPDYTYKIVVMCVFMPDGSPAFTDADIPDMKTQSSLSKMSKLFAAVHKVNGMDAEEEIKNSAAAPSGG